MQNPVSRMVLLACLLATGAGAGWCELQPVQVLLDDVPMSLDGPAYLVDGNVVMAPAISYLGALGALVSWDAQSRVIWAERSGVSLVFAIGSYTGTINGQVRQLGATPRMIGGVPYLFTRLPAVEFGFKAEWDRRLMRFSVTTPSAASVTATKILDQDIEAPSLQHLGLGNLLVIGKTQAAGQPRVAYAYGSNRGSTWQMVEHPLPAGIAADELVVGWGMGIDLLLLGGGMDVAAGDTGVMPFWAISGTDWLGSRLTPAPGVTHRQITDFVVADPQARILYATGFESQGGGGRCRIWRSADSSLSWQPVEPPGLTPFGFTRIHAMAPDYTVWAEADSNLLRINPAGGISHATVPPQLWSVNCISTPNNSDVFMLWKQSLPGSSRMQIAFSHSTDRGATWQHDGEFPWPTDLMDWADSQFGMFAHEFAGSWLLYYTKDRGQHWWRHRLDGWEIVGDRIVVSSSTEAYMLARKQDSGDRRLHCLRWSLGW